MISASLVWWGLAALVLFWSVGAYNRLVRLRSQASRAFGAVATQLLRYGELLHSHSTETDVPTAAWSGLLVAHAQFSASLVVARARPLNAAAVGALGAADQVLQMAWLRLVVERQDQHQTRFTDTLRPQWDEASLQVRHAGQAFAQAVQRYNHAIGQFPALLLALLFGFRAAKPL